ncbi:MULTISPECIES: hypothetical protein [unclassified Pseudomonas]|uniref:hypothetical protein n=1 Tax=unclassified Pseudomonas TaxID=196821 RepID=UPI00384E1BE0
MNLDPPLTLPSQRAEPFEHGQPARTAAHDADSNGGLAIIEDWPFERVSTKTQR